MDKINHPIFAERIQQIMSENGWSLADLAKRVMLSHTAVRKWATGSSAASGERLKRLAAITGKPEHWFFMPSPDAENQASTIARQLDEKEEALLSLFNQLPETEKLRLIIHTKSVLHEVDLLKNDVYDIISDIHKP
ncbi:helix-turn-helix domain-containing protein [Citrobacter braakii]|uniref:helix-turn-helix domain-containing protein n=1 Tax=Citrobacter braakii TaxID=57706 RepID=UPI000542BD45|nr:helix-turn-helix domain-containing protein [Citrobacter braakii]KHE07938.1 regulatory protein [Citrobacter braakii]